LLVQVRSPAAASRIQLAPLSNGRRSFCSW
jgi:hypothetical protein